jgi:peptide chain release factor subunit 1
MEELRGIFIGGPGPSKEKFVRDESLDYRLQEKIMDVVDLGYGGSEGIRALLERVKDNIEDIKYIHEKKVMQKFMSEITSDSGLATYGIKEVEKGLNYGAVDMLIISEELDRYRAKLECSNCGYTEHRIIKEKEFEDTETIIQDEVCPKCSSNTFGLVEHKSLVEAFGEMAESTGADIEIISKETEEGETLYSTFGGVVALLRYKFSY